MKVREVKEIAEQWVSEYAAKIPGFAGAFYTGSITSLPDQENYSSSPDSILLRDRPQVLCVGFPFLS